MGSLCRIDSTSSIRRVNRCLQAQVIEHLDLRESKICRRLIFMRSSSPEEASARECSSIFRAESGHPRASRSRIPTERTLGECLPSPSFRPIIASQLEDARGARTVLMPGPNSRTYSASTSVGLQIVPSLFRSRVSNIHRDRNAGNLLARACMRVFQSAGAHSVQSLPAEVDQLHLPMFRSSREMSKKSTGRILFLASGM